MKAHTYHDMIIEPQANVDFSFVVTKHFLFCSRFVALPNRWKDVVTTAAQGHIHRSIPRLNGFFFFYFALWLGGCCCQSFDHFLTSRPFFSTMHTNHREFIHCCHGGGMECPRFVHGFCTDGPFCWWLVCAHASPPMRKCFVVGKTKFGLKVMRNLPYVRTHLKKVYNLIESVWHPFYDSLSGGVSQYGPTRSGHMFVCEKRTSVISCWREGGNRINQRNTRAVRVHSPNKK